MRAACILRALLAPLLFGLPQGQVKVLGPDKLVSQFKSTHGIVYGTTATFGAPYYGERVLGELVYGETKGANHCTQEDYNVSSASTVKEEKELVRIVLVRRGGCTFVTKVLIAQQKGAHAVVVVDKESSNLTPEQVQKIVMADDGWGDKVRIPSILISKSEGQKLIDSARKESVIAELAWDIPRGQVVVMDFWMSSGSQESSEFLQRFQDSVETLKYHVEFVPHFHTFSLPSGAGMNHLCASTFETCDDCKLPIAKYCAPDPDGPGPISGADVVNEDLRRLCIYNVTAKKQTDTGATYSGDFWDYVVAFFKSCPVKGKEKGYNFGTKCSFVTMEKLGIPVETVKQCIRKLGTEYMERQLTEVAWSPQALRLNGWRYSGPLDPETVLKAVCSGYSKSPKACGQLLLTYSSRPGEHVWIGGPNPWGMLLSTCMVVVLFGVAFLFYKRHVTMTMRRALREEVMLEVQTQMADYVPMEDKGDRGSSSRPGPLSF